ncbi:hypothetical protein [Photorhabdus aegyptia]|uniref:Uncharacterized protein n=1 Tax=Photorhabdus aegyptia TaxID=2805098 RepID=A0A022PNV0_9GAMM|nr:hypothetical protein [Photorhabdus aegyptia]EYU16568.1 hypothetical protein BA1DRAFT_00852 [Photorhabdus aegyptia]
MCQLSGMVVVDVTVVAKGFGVVVPKEAVLGEKLFLCQSVSMVREIH